MFSSDEIRDVARLTQLSEFNLSFIYEGGCSSGCRQKLSTFNLEDAKLDVDKIILKKTILVHFCLTAILTFHIFFDCILCKLNESLPIQRFYIDQYFFGKKKEIVETVGQLSSCKMQFIFLKI